MYGIKIKGSNYLVYGVKQGVITNGILFKWYIPLQNEINISKMLSKVIVGNPPRVH